MFRLEQRGKERSDCTTSYNVVMEKNYTLREFVDAIMSKTDQFGDFAVFVGNLGFLERDSVIHGWYRCGFVRQESLPELTEELARSMVLEAVADGGWGRMDYRVLVEYAK